MTFLFLCFDTLIALYRENPSYRGPPSGLLLLVNRPQQNPQKPIPLPFRLILGEVMLFLLDMLLQLCVRTKHVDGNPETSMVDEVYDADIDRFQDLKQDANQSVSE